MFLYDLLMTLAIPVFIYFPKIAAFYDFAVIFTDVSEITLLLIIVISLFFIVGGTLEIILRGYRALMQRFNQTTTKGSNAINDNPLFSGLKGSRYVKRLGLYINQFFRL